MAAPNQSAPQPPSAACGGYASTARPAAPPDDGKRITLSA
jgi:hypothetical protein